MCDGLMKVIFSVRIMSALFGVSALMCKGLLNVSFKVSLCV